MTGPCAVLVTVTVVLFGLHAGLYATFAYSVMPALRRADSAHGVVAMQRINVAIQNPVFLLIFGGGLLAGAATTVVCWSGPLRWWAVTALLLCVAGMVITVVINVPLNARLDAAGAVSGGAADRAWAAFAGPWISANVARAVLHSASFGVLVAGVVRLRI